MNLFLQNLMNTTRPVWEGEGNAAPPAAGTPPAKPPPGTPSALGGDLNSAPPQPGPATWPDDWRDKMAGDNKDLRKTLDRFAAPTDLGKSYLEAQQRIRSGKADAPPARPADDKPDELKAWRELQGIPADPTGYQLPEATQKRFTDAEKPAIATFLDGMHKRDMAPTAVTAAIETYADIVEGVITQQTARDAEEATAARDILRDEWGAELTNNFGLAKHAAAKLGLDGLFDARLPDGRKVGSVPDFAKALANAGKTLFGDIKFAGETTSKVSADRMGEIKGLMADQNSAYYTDGGKLRAEYAELLTAFDKSQAVQTRTGSESR